MLQPCFVFNSNILTPTEGQLSVPSVGSTGIVKLTISKMEPGQVLIYEYSLKVNENVSLDQEYILKVLCVLAQGYRYVSGSWRHLR